ncbi:MAG: alanine racemase [Candidatus Krumholzibacteriota bacterium]|nr:alanine racemase [Candidatus Krumholzibacteriota bacterium]
MHTLSWLEISRSHLLHNLELFRAQIGPGRELMPVLKANAYGHGLEEVGAVLAAAGCRWFGLHSAEEALRLAAVPELRRMADPRLLLLSAVPGEQAEAVLAAGGRFTVFEPEALDELEAAGARAGRPVPIHLKIETGVQRQGFLDSELPDLAAALRSRSHLRVEGVHTHFANIEDTTRHDYAREQMRRFAAARERLAALGVEPGLVHASCSAAAILFPETYHDLVRVGISLYGHWPSQETRISAQATGRGRLDLRPVLTWKARLIQVKHVPAGSFVGYGCTWKAETDTRLGVLPVGYYDGYDRSLSGAHVLVRGRRAPVRGRVMMNLTLVDLGHLPETARGDEAVLLGSQGEEEVSAELLAGLAGTINYEILSRLGAHLPRHIAD